MNKTISKIRSFYKEHEDSIKDWAEVVAIEVTLAAECLYLGSSIGYSRGYRQATNDTLSKIYNYTVKYGGLKMYGSRSGWTLFKALPTTKN